MPDLSELILHRFRSLAPICHFSPKERTHQNSNGLTRSKKLLGAPGIATRNKFVTLKTRFVTELLSALSGPSGQSQAERRGAKSFIYSSLLLLFVQIRHCFSPFNSNRPFCAAFSFDSSESLSSFAGALERFYLLQHATTRRISEHTKGCLIQSIQV